MKNIKLIAKCDDKNLYVKPAIISTSDPFVLMERACNFYLNRSLRRSKQLLEEPGVWRGSSSSVLKDLIEIKLF